MWVKSLSLALGLMGGGVGRRGGGRRKAERAEVIHDGGAHRDSNLSTPERAGTPLL